MREKLKAFLNGLTQQEFMELYRFLRTRTWAEWVNQRMYGKKID